MKYEGIEGLSENQILELYDEVLEKLAYFGSTEFYCYVQCACDGGTRYGYGYNPTNATGQSNSNFDGGNLPYVNICSTPVGWHTRISGGCTETGWDTQRYTAFYFISCVRT